MLYFFSFCIFLTVESTPVTHEYLKNKKDQEKKSIIAKVTLKNSVNTKVNNEGVVQSILKDYHDNNKIDSILNKNMNEQQENFKKRLEERKNKKLLSTSDCTDAIETFVRALLSL